MAREKAKLEYITDDLKRKVSFRKRKGCVIKKACELSVLCDVDVAAIVYSGHSDPHPEVWPDDHQVHKFIGKYHAHQVLEKSLNQEGLIQKRLNKEKEYLMKRFNENYDEEISQLMISCMGGYADPTMQPANTFDLKMKVDKHLKDLERVIEASDKHEEVYIPAPPTLDGLLINGENEKLADQILQYGIGSDNWNNMENLEYYWNNMGFGASEMPLPFNNANYQNASSSNNLFCP